MLSNQSALLGRQMAFEQSLDFLCAEGAGLIGAHPDAEAHSHQLALRDGEGRKASDTEPDGLAIAHGW